MAMVLNLGIMGRTLKNSDAGMHAHGLLVSYVGRCKHTKCNVSDSNAGRPSRLS